MSRCSKLLRFSVIVLAVLGPDRAFAAGSMVPACLRCEGQDRPLAIDAARPRLSWIGQPAVPARRGLRQSAYQILVATSEERLQQGTGDLWDSGKVASDQSVHVPYAGRTLESRRQCFWKVRLWDQNGVASDWSQPSSFRMGLLAPRDWTAHWIADSTRPAQSLRDNAWVWHGRPDARGMYPPGARYFRKRFALPAGVSFSEASVWMTADNSFKLLLNGREVLQGDTYLSAAQADVTGQLVPGDNVLAVVAINGGNGPNEAGLIGRLAVRLGDGRQLAVDVDASWKASDREQPEWLAAAFDDSAWATVHVLGRYGMPPWGEIAVAQRGLPLFRREFDVAKPIRQALVHICGLGHYELSVNGRRVGEEMIDPEWTNYRKSCSYRTYDVTGQLAAGRNALGVMLGSGMYHVTGGRYIKFRGSFGPPKLIAELEIEHTDGTRSIVATDAAWRTALGPVVFSCTYGGEDYDARREKLGWDRPGFRDAEWAAAKLVDGPGGALRCPQSTPIRVAEEFAAVRVSEPRPGVFVYDLGQNFSGWPKLKVRGPAGAAVKLIPGELLDKAGLVSQASSGGPVWFSYTLRGDGVETWAPRFSYYGFRYVQVEGAVPEGHAKAQPTLPCVLALSGQFLYNAAPQAGRFECSLPLINRIHALILAAMRSNFQSVLTDCPHREKLGWLEVSHLLGRAVMYNYDAARFYAKISLDMAESQTKGGLVPDIAPEYTVFSGGFRDSPEWGSACAMTPWHVWQMYGDAGLLERHYDVIRRYVEYLRGTSRDHIVTHGLGDWYDIGPRGPGPSQLTSTGLTATAIYYGDLKILAATAHRLGKVEDARRYGELATEVRAAFNRRFFHADAARYDRGSQTAQAMPLVLGLVEENCRAAVLDNLVQAIRAGGNRVTAGDVGFAYVVRALSDGGRGDVLYDMVCQPNGPGYADQLQKGATSLTEAWDANPGSSHNHCMLGHAEEWFYRGLAGIVPDEEHPGFGRFVLKPQPVGELRWVKAHYDSVHGRIASHWQIDGDQFRWQITIPPNTTAVVHVPCAERGSVTESGRPVEQAEGVRLLPPSPGFAIYEVQSGEYTFVAHAARVRKQ